MDSNDLKFKKIYKSRLYFLKKKHEDKLYEYTYIKEIPDEKFTTNYILLKIIKKLKSFNNLKNKDLMLDIYNGINSKIHS